MDHPTKRSKPFFGNNLNDDQEEDAPPRKRPRRFTIQDLLDLQDSPPHSPAKNDNNNASKYIQKLEGDSKYNKKYATMQWDSKFIIKDVPEEPEGLLAGIFQYCIDDAIDEAKAKADEPTHLGCDISSILLDPNIFTPIRPVTANTVDVILNQFLKVAQSKKQQGLTLWGEPFSVRITTINYNALPKKRTIKGSGQPKRKLGPVHHRIKDQCLIKVGLI
jgi:hypothetical protein